MKKVVSRWYRGLAARSAGPPPPHGVARRYRTVCARRPASRLLRDRRSDPSSSTIEITRASRSPMCPRSPSHFGIDLLRRYAGRVGRVYPTLVGVGHSRRRHADARGEANKFGHRPLHLLQDLPALFLDRIGDTTPTGVTARRL